MNRKLAIIPTRRQRWLAWLVLPLILAVFGGAIGIITLRMRRDIQSQMVTQSGDVLHAMVMMQFGEVSEDINAPVREPHELVQVLLEATRLQGVLVARLFETDGLLYYSVPFDSTESVLSPSDRAQALRSEPMSRLIEEVRRDELFIVMPDDPLAEVTLPVLEVTVPLQAEAGSEVMGIAQFVVEGDTLLNEFAELDRTLATRAGAIFGVGSLLIALGFGWAVRRLQRANEQLEQRTGDLLRANEELALAARTSAIGSVAAHLIHGLKNPLSGLHQFVNARDANAEGAGAWDAAAASTQRMQQMVSEVVRVLREEEQGVAYELTLPEFEELFRARVLPLAKEAGVDFQVIRNADVPLNNLQANLLVLILGNLVQNAIQASPKNGLVTLGMEQRGSGIEFRVIDQGAGLPEIVRSSLFSPCRSSKEGGTGIGLAISRQLAVHLGAELSLESSTGKGTVFVLLFSPGQRFTRTPLDNAAQQS